ncbi:MAG: MFS transporter [Clostridiales bacterium]|nr:MFS transporter [Clostridiales bacterium]
MTVNNPFSALKHKNFRYYWLGMCISTIGTWMQNVAQPWLAYKLTNSAFLLSLIGALQFLPMLMFSLFAGVLVDRLSKKKILLFTQTASLITTFLLAFLVWTGKIQYWHLLAAAAVLGVINTLDMPARQAFIIELVDKGHLMNAIALNSAVFNLARTIGPAAAGIVMDLWGIEACFFINSISFAAVVFSLFFIHPNESEKSVKKEESIMKNIAEGLKYIYTKKILLATILIMGVVGTFAINFNVLVTVFSVQSLGQSETGYGLLMSCMGMGSFMGAMLVASISKSGPKKFVMYIVPVLVGLSLIAIGLTKSYSLACIALAVAGFFFVMYSSTANSAIQINTDAEHLGRVMSVYTLVFAGSTPIGNLFAGAITERLDARLGFISCGAAIIVLLLPIYIYLARLSKKA